MELRCKYAPFWQEFSVKSDAQVTVKACGPLVNITMHIWIGGKSNDNDNIDIFFKFQQPTARHVFSNHDNRESFLNDALYFEQVSAGEIQWFSELLID